MNTGISTFGGMLGVWCVCRGRSTYIITYNDVAEVFDDKDRKHYTLNGCVNAGPRACVCV